MENLMENITYTDLVGCFGKDNAHQLLLAVEKVAQIQNDIILIDQDIRFKKALEALNEINFA